eukprot:1347770-Pyramimonas_sp.AAC.1
MPVAGTNYGRGERINPERASLAEGEREYPVIRGCGGAHLDRSEGGEAPTQTDPRVERRRYATPSRTDPRVGRRPPGGSDGSPRRRRPPRAGSLDGIGRGRCAARSGGG